MLDPYTYRCPAGHPDPCPVCSGGPHLEELLQYEGPSNVAAVILETVVGPNGVIVPPDGYLQSIREVCDRYGVLLICDEVIAGFGRTGKWFACENWDVVPDILVVAKGINSGYVPLAAMVFSEKIADWVRDKYFASGLTYSGHPLACASAIASIETFRRKESSSTLLRWGPSSRADSTDSRSAIPRSETCGGSGCLWGLELVKNRETREPLVPFNPTANELAPVAQMAKAALDDGLYLMTRWNMVMVCPPLNITIDELDEGIAILDRALAVADEFVG